jgi:hypothetical protein
MTLAFAPRLNYQHRDLTIGHWQRYGLDWIDNSGMIIEVPDYQRDFVWEDKRYADFIASIFDRVQPQALVIDNRDWTKLVVVDGKHRLRALIRFFGDDLVVRGQRYSELPQNVQREFTMSIPMPVLFTENMSDAEVIRLYLSLNFERVPHQAQDRERAEQILEDLDD